MTLVMFKDSVSVDSCTNFQEHCFQCFFKYICMGYSRFSSPRPPKLCCARPEDPMPPIWLLRLFRLPPRLPAPSPPPRLPKPLNNPRPWFPPIFPPKFPKLLREPIEDARFPRLPSVPTNIICIILFNYMLWKIFFISKFAKK